MFKKLSSKIIVFAVVLAVIITLVLSGITMIQIDKNISENAATQLKSIALYSASEMDKILFGVEGKVDSIAYNAVKNVDKQKLFAKDMNYFRQYEAGINEQAIEQLGNLEGVLAAYVRYEPALTYGTSGLFYTDTDGDGTKEAVTPTDLLAYDKEDKEHVGWFYEPLALGEASWMEPYYNSNLDKTIISYVVPFYIDGTGFGVAGVDFDFAYIAEVNNRNNVYDTGYTFMLGKDYKFISHPQYVNGEKIDEVENGALAVVKEKMQTDPNGFIDTGKGKNNIIMGYAALDNGWIVGISPTSQEVYANLTSTIQLLLAAAVILVIISSLVAYIMGRIMTKSVSGLVKDIDRISNGDFSVQIRTRGKDEISNISKQLSLFVERMKQVIVELSTTSRRLEKQALESTDISGGMYHLIEGQTHSTEKLKYFVENLVQATDDIANNATSLAHTVSEVNTQAENAKQKMKDTVTMSEKGRVGMVKVQENMVNMNSLINDLEHVVMEVGDSANEINEIIQIIGDIAEQTNLLSLNASIEAARAGEAGKGFAVVASEIGNLAKMCTDAAKQISDLIKKVNSQVGTTVNKTQYAVDDIKANKGLVDDSYHMFMDIYGCVKEADVLLDGVTQSIRSVDDVASSMAAITEEQSASTEEMQTVSDEIYNHAIQTKEAGKGVTTVAEELEKTADNVKKIADFFQI